MEKISIREKICYGLGDSSANIFLGMTMMFLPYFYTDVVGISAASMGVLFLVIRLFDACYDPFIGNIADNTRSKYGRYRPWLLYLAIPYGLSCFLVFSTPDFSETGKLIYAYGTYFFLILMYASTVVPYVGLLTALSNDPMERLSINSYRFPLAKMSFLLCSTVIPMFVAMYGKENEAQGYQTAMALIAVLATVFLLLCFWGTKERNTTLPSTQQNNKEPFFKQVKLIFKTKPAVYYYLFFIANAIAFTLKGSVAIYFVKYYLQQDDAFLSGVLSATAIAGIIAPIVAMQLIKHGYFTKIGMAKFSNIAGGVIALLLLVVPQNSVFLCVACLVASVLFAELCSIIVWALPSDCADYCEVKYNKKMSGILGAGALFSLKLGMSLAGALVGWVLAYAGYEANSTVVSTETAFAILMLISILPAICHFIAYMFLRFYTLDDKKMEEIKVTLINRQIHSEN